MNSTVEFHNETVETSIDDLLMRDIASAELLLIGGGEVVVNTR
jgi:hypothetical protein